jgi:CheY-like chemotaxis protein
MSRILLADDSTHAQRMGERILSEEGFEVVTVSDGDSALVRLEDVDPDLVLADVVMPNRSGYELCQYIRLSPRHRHVRVLLTAGFQETIDEAEVQRAKADGVIQKPFEASVLIRTVKPLLEAAARERGERKEEDHPTPPVQPAPDAPIVALVDQEEIRAAVILALDRSLDGMADEITRRVVMALTTKTSPR